MIRKDRIFLIPFVLIAILVFSVAIVSAQIVEVPLIADGGSPDTAITVGFVAALIEGPYLCVGAFTYEDPCWDIIEGKAAVATDPADLPQTGSGNPKIGQFPIRFVEWEPGVHYLCGVPIEYTPGDTVYIAVHADVVDTCDCTIVPDTGEEICREETAWGAGEEFSGNNWAMYFSIDTY